MGELKIVKREVHVTEDVRALLEIDWCDGELLDTAVTIDGSWVVAGFTYPEFLEKLRTLIDEYRI
jgi:hypothetical protein